MSKYTTEVRYICEVNADLDESKGFNDVDEIITAAAPKIFNFEFPIYDEAYRLPFEKMILRHFYTREIGLETVGLWKLKLWDKLNLIMPYYNKMYESALLEFNPLYDVDITTTHTGQGSDATNDSETISEDRSKSGSDSNTHWDMYSDTPQGSLRNINMGDNDDTTFNTYLTDARKITDGGSQTVGENNLIGRERAGTVTSMDSYTNRVFGKRGIASYSQLIREFRKTFLRIDEMVCKELEELFLGLW